MVLILAQIFVSILLIVAILLQMQGSGLSTVFGGGGEFYRSRRSLEKFLMYATVAFSVVFAILSILLLLNR